MRYFYSTKDAPCSSICHFRMGYSMRSHSPQLPGLMLGARVGLSEILRGLVEKNEESYGEEHDRVVVWSW